MTRTTIPGARRPLLGLLVTGLVAIGCTSADAKTAEMGASCDQFGAQKSITQATEMTVGNQVNVTLCSNPTTGFSWQGPEISNGAAVSLADKSFGSPVVGATQVVGAAGTASITAKANAKGTSTVVVGYKPGVARGDFQRVDLQPDGDGPAAPVAAPWRFHPPERPWFA